MLGAWCSMLGGGEGTKLFQNMQDYIWKQITAENWNKNGYIAMCFFETIKCSIIIMVFSFTSISWILDCLYFGYRGIMLGLFMGYAVQAYHTKAIGIIVSELFPQGIFYFLGALLLVVAMNKKNKYLLTRKNAMKDIGKKAIFVGVALIIFGIGSYLEGSVHIALVRWLITKNNLVS